MEQVAVVKGAYSGNCLWLIQIDFMNLENRKFFQYKAFLFLKNFPPLFLCCSQAFELDHMAHECADDDTHASEYFPRPPNNSDSDAGLSSK